MAERSGMEIAIVGMAGRFPGAADTGELWRNLRRGAESIRFFSAEELAAAGVDPALAGDPAYVPANGLLEGLEHFDAPFFGIPPREAEIIDPQQRIFLECAWHALEDAGYDPAHAPGSVGVYGGVSLNTYLPLSRDVFQRLGDAAGVFQVLVGNDRDFLATRATYKLDLKGPGVVVQTACSTSLVAVHLACRALLGGECDMALAGGVSARVPQQAGYLYQEGGILSPDGHCRAFDARARGTVPGAGVGLVTLKRLDDALADGDTVRAVIKGSAINNDGALKVGYTAPSIEGQAAAIRAALRMAEVAPETIAYVEAHGTGTPLGDPIEVAALTRVFRESTRERGFCGLGSIKTNIGHLDAAAGIAGLIKAVLALGHREIPPSLHFESPNPKIDFDAGPFYVNDRLHPWPDPQGSPRRAGVSSFGIGGTNCHVVLEEAPPPAPSGPSRREQVLLLSARTGAALDRATERLAESLRRVEPAPALADVAYTLASGRSALGRRRALVAASGEEAAEALSGSDPRPSLDREALDAPPVAFLFPGQGAQRSGMGREVYRAEPVLREALDRCFALLEEELGEDPRPVLWDAGSAERLDDTRWAQPALLALEWSLARLWREWGVEPAAMIGHSLGEYAAACVAGVLEIDDALRLVVLRGRLMAELPPGAMLLVPLPESEVRRLLERLDRAGERLAVAAVNGPALCVVSGRPEAVDELAAELPESAREAGRRLRVSHAFHSSMMDPILDRFGEAVSRLTLRPPSVPWISNLSGRPIAAEEATDPRYWVRHLRDTVRFGDGVGHLLETAERPLLEVGPGTTLTTLARRHPDYRDQPVLTSLTPASGPRTAPREPGSETRALGLALGGLWTCGVEVDWRRYHRGETRRRVPLPTYPFERLRYWLDDQARGTAAPTAPEPLARRDDVGRWLYSPQWRRTAAGSAAAGAPRRCLLLYAGALGAALALRLRGAGCTVIEAAPATRCERRGDQRWTLAPTESAHYGTLLGELAGEGRPGDGDALSIVQLWPVDAGDEELLERGFFAQLALARALASAGVAVEWTVVTAGVHEVVGGEALRPLAATALGPSLAAPQELPSVACRAVDLPGAAAAGEPAAELVEALAAEILDRRLWSGPGAAVDRVVALRGGHRWLQSFEPLAAPAVAGIPDRLRRGGVYLVTGGLGAIGLAIAEHLAESARARLVLLGRRGFAPRTEWPRLAAGDDDAAAVARRLLRLEERAGGLLVVSADVADPERMARLRGEIHERFGALHGILHAAGVPPSGVMPRRSPEAARAVLRPKVEGTRVIAETFAADGLDLLLLFSSLRALTGGAGTADYAAANAFLDAFAHQARRSGIPVLAVDWDGWREAGMGASADERTGMSTAEGIEVFRRLLHSAAGPQVAVCVRDLDALVAAVRAATPAGPAAGASESRPAPKRRKRYPRPRLDVPFVAPSTPAEETLAEIWRELLGLEEVGVDDNLFDLGGDSVVSLRIVARATAAGLTLTAGQAFRHPTISELAALAAQAGAAAAEQGAVEGAVPLTPIQSWYFELEVPRREHWNQSVLLAAPEIDRRALTAAAAALLVHHDALRLRFTREGGEWSQRNDPAPAAVPPVPTLDLSALPAADQGAAIEQAAWRIQGSLDLAEGPLVRWALLRLGRTGGDRLLWLAHHLAVDALAWRVLLEDLETAYGAALRGEPIELPAKTTSFQEWSERLSAHVRSGGFDDQRRHWLATAAAEVAPLPRDLPGGAALAGRAETVTAGLDEETTRAVLREIPAASGTGIDDALITALAQTLADWTGRRAIAIDLEGHGREAIFDDLNTARTVGWFTALYPVVVELGEATDPGALLRSVHERLARVPGGGIGYGALRHLHPDPELRRRLAEASAEVSYVYLGQADDDDGGGAFSPATEAAGRTVGAGTKRPHLLEVRCAVRSGRLRTAWVYSPGIHRRETVERLAHGFLAALRRLVEASRAASPQDRLQADLSRWGWSEEDAAAVLSQLTDGEGAR